MLVAAVSVLAVVDAFPGAGGLAALCLGMTALGASGALWGRDSIAGGDWAPDGRARALSP